MIVDWYRDKIAQSKLAASLSVEPKDIILSISFGLEPVVVLLPLKPRGKFIARYIPVN